MSDDGYCCALIADEFAGTCDYPADHEIHDEQRARKGGWRYHQFVPFRGATRFELAKFGPPAPTKDELGREL